MSNWKLTVLALVFGLVFCGAANAAVTNLTLTLEIVDYATGVALTPAQLAALAPGNTFGVAVTALATGIPDGLGVWAASWAVYTPNFNGVVDPVGTGMGGGTPVTKFGNIYFDLTNGGSVQDLKDSAAFPTGSTLDPDTDKDLVLSSVSTCPSNMDQWITPTLVQTQQWKVLAGGSGVTLAMFAVGVDTRSQWVDMANEAGGYVSTFETVGPQGGGNTAPTVSIPGGDVTEPSWSDEPGWNNLAHSVTVTAAGVDAESDPLTYAWTITKPGGASKPLGATGAVLNLTLAEIASLGLPAYVGVDDASYHWSLSVVANDGLLTSAPAVIGVFVPEPATMGLLAFGVVGLLKRRRRA